MSYSNQLVYDIFQKLYPKPNDFVVPKRFFIREGDVIMFHPNKRRRVTRHFYLFNDRLLITKRKQSSFAKYSDWLKIDVSLRVREVDIESMQTVSNNNEFRLHLPGRLSYIFFASSAEERDSWVADIVKSMKAEHPGDPKAKKKEEQKAKEEKTVQKEEKTEKKKKEIVINDSEGSSDDETHTRPVDKARSKMNTRVKSELVAPSRVQRERKSTHEPTPNNTSQPAVEKAKPAALDFDPFAPTPIPKGSPTKTPVSKVKGTPKRTKVSSSPVYDHKPLSGANPTSNLVSSNPFQPIPFNLNTGINQYPTYTPFTGQTAPNPYITSPQVLSLNPQPLSTSVTNPFAPSFTVQPQIQQNPQPFFNTIPQAQFPAPTTLPNNNPFIQANNTLGGPQNNVFFG